MKYAVVSDIHLGHKKTPTPHIIDSFTVCVLNEQNQDIDVLFINGDLFDHLLQLNTPTAQAVVQFFHRLLDYCHAHDIKLRVLEGTPGHDWYQSALLVKMNDVRTKQVDLRYHKVLDVEYIEGINKHVLYIPDEWCSSQPELERQINEKFKEHGITKVDMSMLHGQFKYQMQGHPSSAFGYDEAYFLNLTRGYIHIGHYHVFSQYDRIVANGSLERLVHGEEKPKGYVRVDDERMLFIPNTKSCIYKTITMTMATTLQSLDKQIHQLPKHSHVRLLMAGTHPFYTVFEDLRLRYPTHNLKKLSKEAASEKTYVTYITDDCLPLHTEHLYLETNLYDALMQSIKKKHVLSEPENTKLLEFARSFQTSQTKDTLKDTP